MAKARGVGGKGGDFWVLGAGPPFVLFDGVVWSGVVECGGKGRPGFANGAGVGEGGK